MVQIDIGIPENCVECPIHDGEYGWCNVNKDISVNLEERPRKCPIIEPEQQEQQHGRVFKGIVVKYPLYSTYLEYIGKPYFSIKYTENGQEFIGYGTYNPEVLSEYLITYFMPSAKPEYYDYSDIEPLWKSFAEENDINLTDTAKQLKDAMWCGYRKGKADAQPEQRWIPCSERLPEKHGEMYLVTISDGSVYSFALQWDINRKRWYLSFLNNGESLIEYIDDVIAWMPLPEPYQEEGE